MATRRSAPLPCWFTATWMMSILCSIGCPSGLPDCTSNTRTHLGVEASTMQTASRAMESVRGLRTSVRRPLYLTVLSNRPSYVYRCMPSLSTMQKWYGDCSTNSGRSFRSNTCGGDQCGDWWMEHCVAVVTMRAPWPTDMSMTRSRKSKSSVVSAMVSLISTVLSCLSVACRWAQDTTRSLRWEKTTCPLPHAPASTVLSSDHASWNTDPL
mmetsp:Transcript_941/g.2445  ORF Transcript_941/g.2445 Transcript_941/m.2445 type:complete len:211 (+) Transcript_941:1112-1744(+)